MFLRILSFLSVAGLSVLGGCASLDNVVGGIANAPEWFQERRVEIRGEGYPDLNEVPVAAPIAGSNTRLALSAREAEEARETLFGHPRAALAHLTLQDMQQTAASLRPQLPNLQPKPEGFLSESELDALRAQVGNR